MYTGSGVLFEVWVSKQRGPAALCKVFLQQLQIVMCHILFAAAHIEQVQVIIYLIHLGIIGILVYYAGKVFLAQTQVVKLVFEYYAGTKQFFHYYLVALFYLLRRKGYLRQVIFTLVRVVLRVGISFVYRVFRCLLVVVYRVSLLFGVGIGIVIVYSGYYGFVNALPVVCILSLSP